MKMDRSSYSDYEEEFESEVQSVSVSNYHLFDDKGCPVSFDVLPIQWDDSENSGACNEKVFLEGDADGGLLKICMEVTAWRFDLSNVRPEVFLLAKDGRWIEIQKPRKSFLATIRTVLITLRFLHTVKRKHRMSVDSLWKDLSKDKELSFYGSKPSEDDVSNHMLLIDEASKRDAVLAKSKLLLMVLEKLKSKKFLDEEVNNFEQPRLSVVGIDYDMLDISDEESEEMDVCALCDNGGDVICCEGVCMRSFHATKEADRENNCFSLGFTQKEVDDIRYFYCKNCAYRQHQCFACGKLGSSDKVIGAEVFKCPSATCDRFYHPPCLAKLLPEVVKHGTPEFERYTADGIPFACPLHYCCVCNGLENMMDPELQFAVCRRCPKAYHRKCLPREITADKNGILRVWEGLLPWNRILIYCLNHEIDPELGTPVRDHIKFPKIKDTAQKIDTVEQKKSSTKKRVMLKKNIDSDGSSGKSTGKGSKVTGKLSSDKVGSKKPSKKRISSSNMSKKPKSKEGKKLHNIKNEGSEQFEQDNQKNNSDINLLSVKPIGKPNHLPGSVVVHDRQMDERNVKDPILSLWSPSDWTSKHKVIAQEYDHVCSEHQVLETEKFKSDTLAAAVHATGGTYADNSKLTDDQEDQASETGNGHKSSSHDNGDEYRKDKPEKSRRKRKHIEENNTQAAVISAAKRLAVRDMPDHIEENNTQPAVISAVKRLTVRDMPDGVGPRKFSKSISFGRKGGHRFGFGGLHGFATAPNYEYASKHSCGWLEE